MRKAFLGLATFAALFVFAATCAAAEGDAAKEIKGSAGCSMCCFKAEGGCSAAVKVGDTTYALKASEKADEATQKLIKSFAGAKKTVDVVIKGVIKEKTIIADSVTASKG
jgi:hypothetical protein